MIDVSRFGKVAVLMGGDSNEREVSLKSGAAIVKALQASGVDAHEFDPKEREISHLVSEGFSRAFIALHGKDGEDGVVQGKLAMLKIPFTGSNMLASAIGMDKVRSKTIWKSLGLAVIPGTVVEHQQALDQDFVDELIASYGTRLMVKPATEGSSLGMTLCDSRSDIIAAIVTARRFSNNVIVERWMSGPEYTVAIIGNHCLPSIKIQPQHAFYDYSAKYESASGTQYFCPSGLSDEAEDNIQTIALKAFLALGCSGWGRVDFMADGDAEQFHLMELNTIPGMTETSLVPKAADVDGISFDELCLQILETSMHTTDGGRDDTQ